MEVRLNKIYKEIRVFSKKTGVFAVEDGYSVALLGFRGVLELHEIFGKHQGIIED